MEGSNLITKLQAKHDLLQRTLGEGQLSERVGEMTWIISCVVYVFHEEYEPCEFVLEEAENSVCLDLALSV